jgi:hypothetical protein
MVANGLAGPKELVVRVGFISMGLIGIVLTPKLVGMIVRD